MLIIVCWVGFLMFAARYINPYLERLVVSLQQTCIWLSDLMDSFSDDDDDDDTHGGMMIPIEA